ncbi:MAG: PQQ-dependent sugar dehydrogenase [Halioglobus sp.]
MKKGLIRAATGPLTALAIGLASWTATAADYKLVPVASDLANPWSIAQLPDNSFLVTLRAGKLLHIDADGSSVEIAGVPDTYFAGQGGFFDIVLHPQFDRNRVVYLSYAHGTPEANGTAIIRAVLTDDALEEAKQILLVAPQKDTPQHYGGRMLFLPDNTLLLSTGDGFEYREAAQDTSSELGKVLRVNDDGSIPADNPFQSAGSERVWSYGHRNPQGLALDQSTGTVYLHEHGPKGGDEINIIEPGNNYGWPAISYGVDYSGAYVSPFTEAPGMIQPSKKWVPSIAPSGMALYQGQHFPQWQGDLFVGALVDMEVRRVDLEKGEVVGEEPLFTELEERIRDIRMGSDGYLYILTDGKGQLLRVTPK